MKVIFTETIKGVASRGDVKNVKNGFYRNYLFPKRKAVPATDALLKEWEERRKKMLIKKEQVKTQLEEMKRRISGAKFRLEKKVTKKGTLYGGVKASDIVKAIKEQYNIEIPETYVVMGEQIKSVGAYEIKLNLGEGIETNISLEVSEKA